MENVVLSIAIKWIHLIATVAWIGGMFTNFFVYLPALGKVLDPPTMGKLMGIVMKRFKMMVYISIVIFIITGILMGFVFGGSNDISSGDSWGIILFAKIAVFFIMIVLAVYAFEVLAPKVAGIAAEGPSPKLVRLQKVQMSLAMTGFILGIIILALSASF